MSSQSLSSFDLSVLRKFWCPSCGQEHTITPQGCCGLYYACVRCQTSGIITPRTLGHFLTITGLKKSQVRSHNTRAISMLIDQFDLSYEGIVWYAKELALQTRIELDPLMDGLTGLE